MASSSIHNLVHSKDTMHIATRPKITALPTKNLFNSVPMRHTRSTKLSHSSPTRPPLRAVAAGRPNAAREPPNELEESPIKIAIIGFGNFGQFIARGIKRQGHIVLATSRSDYSEYCNQHGIQFFQSMDAMCEEQPDVVLVCSSILSTESVLRAVPLHKLKPDTIFADVLSVKQFPRNLLLEVLPSGFGVVCTHPMFGPESGKHGWNELPFVYDKVRVSNDGMQARRCAQFLSIFEREGCRMVEMSCEEHDRHAAGSQFITHTIGRILSHLELESTPINTRGYETLLKLTENTISDSFDLYYGLFMYNVNASEQIENLDRAFETVKQKLFGRLHDILRKQIVERVPMQGVPARGRETNISNYFLADAEKITTLSYFSSPAQDESRADEATLSS
ncbi:arogenate dehydrogenase 2, chloroplastic-like [Typha latifolia]|uniref:arogenate dehydrogenase 2, chloroplastic-like n=1 Tax=Typha latifolia TaxID=4733 RepID=UPI003C307744